MDDGKKLTDTKHRKLLNSFKYWITATDNPLENGGKIISPVTAYQKTLKVIALINAILLYSKELKLAKYHLQNVNDDFWLNILMKFAQYGSFHGVYDFDKRVKALLDNACHGVTNIDVQKFRDKYSYIARNVAPDDVFLSLEARDKACAWLFEQGFYIQGTGIDYDGNCAILSKLLFDGILLYHDLTPPSYPEV